MTFSRLPDVICSSEVDRPAAADASVAAGVKVRPSRSLLMPGSECSTRNIGGYKSNFGETATSLAGTGARFRKGLKVAGLSIAVGSERTTRVGGQSPLLTRPFASQQDAARLSVSTKSHFGETETSSIAGDALEAYGQHTLSLSEAILSRLTMVGFGREQ